MDNKESICMETAKPVDVRKIFKKNERERMSCDHRTRIIDLERRATCARLGREERDLKSQLERLQTQKKAVARDDTTDQLSSSMVQTLDLSETTEVYERQSLTETELINPYPVTIGRTRRLSIPGTSGRLSPSSLSTRQSKDWAEFEDLSSPNSSKLLPPIQSQSRNLISIKSDSTTIRSSSSCIIPLECRGSHGDIHTPPEIWVGDPEAISSVRRNRKSPAQQRQERNENAHRWARSRSLKEGANIQRKDTKVNLSRSHSLKEPNLNSMRRQSMSRCSTARSRTSSIGKTSSECSLSHQMDEMHDSGKGQTSQSKNNEVVKGILKVNLCTGSNSASDNRTAVWGWIESIDTDTTLTDQMPEVALVRRSSIKKLKDRCSFKEAPSSVVRKSSLKKGSMPSSLQIMIHNKSSTTAGSRTDSDSSSPANSPKWNQKKNESESDGFFPNQKPATSSHLSVDKCFEILAAASPQDNDTSVYRI